MAIDTRTATPAAEEQTTEHRPKAPEANGTRHDASDVLEHVPYPIPEADAFVGTRGFLPGYDLDKIANEWIRTRPEQFGFLGAYTIVWLWKGKANRRGWTKQAKDLLGYFAEDIDFVIWLGADVLREEQFTHHQVRAQVFHELLHIVQDDKGKVGVRAEHEFEGYVAELDEFGPWTAELARAKRSLDRAPSVGWGPLFDDEDDEGVDTGV